MGLQIKKHMIVARVILQLQVGQHNWNILETTGKVLGEICFNI